MQQLDLQTREVLRTWPSVSAAARGLGVPQGNISYVALGKFRISVAGFGWRFVDAQAAGGAPDSALPLAQPAEPTQPLPQPHAAPHVVEPLAVAGLQHAVQLPVMVDHLS